MTDRREQVEALTDALRKIELIASGHATTPREDAYYALSIIRAALEGQQSPEPRLTLEQQAAQEIAAFRAGQSQSERAEPVAEVHIDGKGGAFIHWLDGERVMEHGTKLFAYPQSSIGASTQAEEALRRVRAKIEGLYGVRPDPRVAIIDLADVFAVIDAAMAEEGKQ